MPTLKEFEEALREHGMNMALALLQRLRERDRATRSVKPARRITGKKMTPELARTVLELHASSDMTQQEIAFRLGVNQGRVNEVIKRGKWLTEDPQAPEAIARDKAKARMERPKVRPSGDAAPMRAAKPGKTRDKSVAVPRKGGKSAQLSLGDL